MKRYRAGIIGCGGMGRRHAAAYAQMDNVELIAGADPSDRREAEHGQQGVQRFYRDAKAMLAQEKLDLVSVCTPPARHAAMTVVAAEAGVQGIICEKPMAKDLLECDAMIAACKRNQVKLAIGHQRRYGSQYLRGRELVRSGSLGEPLLLWAMTPGSDVMTWGVHWLDMFHFLLEGHSVSSVMGQVDVEKQRLTGHQEFVENALVGHLIFDNGFRAILECGDAAQLEPGFPHHATIRVYGPGGRFEANDIGSTITSGDRHEHQPVESPFNRGADMPDVQMWINQAQELIDCIEQDKEHPCNGEAGRRTIEIACAIWESAHSHRLIQLPMAAGPSALDSFWRGENKPWQK